MKFSEPRHADRGRGATAASIEVRDRGVGIAADERDLVFDRFYRATAARSQPGSGLGLAIVRQIARDCTAGRSSCSRREAAAPSPGCDCPYRRAVSGSTSAPRRTICSRRGRGRTPGTWTRRFNASAPARSLRVEKPLRHGCSASSSTTISSAPQCAGAARGRVTAVDVDLTVDVGAGWFTRATPAARARTIALPPASRYASTSSRPAPASTSESNNSPHPTRRGAARRGDARRRAEHRDRVRAAARERGVGRERSGGLAPQRGRRPARARRRSAR